MTTYNYAEVHGHKMFHREAGDKSAPAIVLLHGFPTSSHLYRNLIPQLADNLLQHYSSNIALYDGWHEYFRTSQPRTLIVWGKNDPFFTVEGAKAYQRDLPKAELHLLDTGVASYFRRSEEFGIPKRDFSVDMCAVRGRKRRMVSSWNNVYLENYKKSGAEFILGSGRFIGPKTLEVRLHDGTIRRLRGTNVIINTGTRAAFRTGSWPG